VTTPPAFDSAGLLTQSGPLSRDTAQAALAQAAAYMTSADFLDAARLYQRVVGFNDAAITAAAMIGLGEALHRLDEDDQALGQWEAATQLAENEHTYAAWRNVAAARVRGGDLRGALNAYREADRRAPQSDKAEIAARMGWLSKELGDGRASGRYFARARGDAGFSFTIGVIAVTAIVSILASLLPPGVIPESLCGPGAQSCDLYTILELDKVLLAAGELYRLWSVTLVHAPIQEMPLHLIFNMYLLYLTGPVVEKMYGRFPFLLMYLVAAAGGSLASFAIGTSPDQRLAVGASGAVFGMFGLLIAAEFIHRPALDRQSRGVIGQLVTLVILNLILGFTVLGNVDNWAHIGGLVTGLWLGVLLAPTRVPTLRSMWLRPGPTPGSTVAVFGGAGTRVIRIGGLVGLAVFFGLLWTLGVAAWG